MCQYKKRKCTGGAIHIAALQADGELLEQLLELRVDINVECRYMTFEKEGRAQPIHLAVQAAPAKKTLKSRSSGGSFVLFFFSGGGFGVSCGF